MIAKTIQWLNELESTPEALERTRGYLCGRMRQILHPNEKVLICFPDEGARSLGGLLKQVLLECKCKPVFWGPDMRWKGLLRQAFESYVSAVMGPPLVVLGLMKLSKATHTPLNIHNAFLLGYPYTSWMIEGIKRGLDCRTWGCYWIGDGPVIAGFTCDKEAGIHIREDIFEAQVRRADGSMEEDAQRGALTLHYKPNPNIIYDTQETAKIWHQPCSCGCDDARIVETLYVGGQDPARTMLEDRFLSWSSVLDYQVSQEADGLHAQLVVFPGENLPEISGCADVQVRAWDPNGDAPFCMKAFAK